MHHFPPTHVSMTTTARNKYQLLWTEDCQEQVHTGRPVLAVPQGDEEYIMLHTGPGRVKGRPFFTRQLLGIFDQLGGWMWENITSDDYPIHNFTLLIEGIQTSLLIFNDDRSYNRKQAAAIRSTGWIICCTKTRQKLQVSFYEKSKVAISCIGKIIGMCVLLLLASAMEEYVEFRRW